MYFAFLFELQVVHLRPRNGRLALSALEPTDPCTNARIPPSLPEVLDWTAIVSREHKVLWLLASNTAHEDLEDVLSHLDHALIAVLSLSEIDDVPNKSSWLTRSSSNSSSRQRYA
jgi:hypothetical protein